MPDAPPRKKDGLRETMEAIATAFVFAFLFKTFEAEAFVIPTGSMAPTLYGRHKDVGCPGCDLHFAVGASREVDEFGYLLLPEFRYRVDEAVCPNCGYVCDLLPLPPFKGDRILVNKWPFALYDPPRWAVTVFKFPENPTTNYIKRLVGLPGETIEVRQGDVYRVGTDGAAEILRKDRPDKQRELGLPVHDHDLPPAALLAAGWPERWAPVRPVGKNAGGPRAVAGWDEEDDSDGWRVDPEARTFALPPGQGTGPHWLRYRHFSATPEDWADALHGLPLEPRARLILDLCGYNPVGPHGEPNGAFWVGDLTVSAEVTVRDLAPNPSLVLELVEGNRTYRCRIDPSTGAAVLSIRDTLARDAEADVVLAKADTDLAGPGRYDVAFSNVDDRLNLWVDGSPAEFDGPTTYAPFARTLQRPWEADLTPVGIAGENVSLRVAHLRLERDTYYRASFRDPDDRTARRGGGLELDEVDDLAGLARAADDPDLYARRYGEMWNLGRRGLDPRLYRLTLGPDEYLMLGDNSPSSLDSRLWPNTRGAVHRHAVPGDALVGTAFAIYWPHGVPVGNYDETGAAHGYAPRLPLLERYFYHVGQDGKLVTDYQENGVPFLPNFGRLFRRIY